MARDDPNDDGLHGYVKSLSSKRVVGFRLRRFTRYQDGVTFRTYFPYAAHALLVAFTRRYFAARINGGNDPPFAFSNVGNFRHNVDLLRLCLGTDGARVCRNFRVFVTHIYRPLLWLNNDFL